MRYLALGDSYTIGEGVAPGDRWPEQLAARLREEGPDLAVQVIARTGWSTDELAEAIAAAAPSPPFELVTLLVGVNDQYRGRSAEASADGYRALLVEAIRLAGGAPAGVIAVSIPDWGVTPFAAGRDRSAVARKIDAFNAMERRLAVAAGVEWVDVTALSRNHPAEIVADGLHPSAAQYARWVEAILPRARHALRGHR